MLNMGHLRLKVEIQSPPGVKVRHLSQVIPLHLNTEGPKKPES